MAAAKTHASTDHTPDKGAVKVALNSAESALVTARENRGNDRAGLALADAVGFLVDAVEELAK